MALKPIINFSSGEASPKLRGRADTVPYNTAAETLENVLGTKYGSVFRTPGRRHVAQVKDSSDIARLIPFVFSSGSAYILLFGDQYMRAFQSGGQIVETAKTITGITQANPAVVTSASHGYSDGDYVDISGVSGMTEVNGKRYVVAAATTNTFELNTEDGANVNSTGFTAYSSGGEAERVYEIATSFTTTELPNLNWTQKGDLMYIASGTKPLQKLIRTSSTSWAIADIVYDTVAWPPFIDINVTATTITPSATTGTSITLTASTSIFTANHVGSYWKLDHSGTVGYVKVTGYSSGTSVTADVVVTLGGTGATADWYEGAWSDERGHPVDVKFHNGRLKALGTSSDPLTVWNSVIEEYDNFNTQVGSSLAESDAFALELDAAQLDKILWGYPTDIMNIGTASGPFTLDADSATDINRAKQQNENGASSVSPVRVGSFVYYIERSDELMGEFAFNLDLNIFKTKNITYLNDHILDSGVVEMVVQRYPDTIIWCVLSDGGIATCTREIDQQVTCWTRQEFSGTDVAVENVASIPNGSEDQVWFVVKRTINGATRRYVEYLESFEQATQADEFFVDSGLTYSGVATTTLTNLDHLEGETVAILADGSVHPRKTVSSGQITLDYEAEKAQVGLPYTSTIKTMDVELASEIGSAQTRVKQISKVFVRILESLGMLVGDGVTMDPVPFRDSSMPMDAPPMLFSGDREVLFPSGADINKYVVVKQEQPLPLHVLGIYIKMLVSTGGAPS